MDSAQLTPTQLTKINHVHYKSLRRIFGIKSSFFHRVISPTSEECSNQYLSGLSYNSRRVITPSQIYSQNRLTLLGHLFRHRDSLEFHSTFMPSGQYRYTRGPNRVGRPRLHWAESVMSEASNRLRHMESDEPPTHYEIYHSFFAIPNISAVRSSHISSSLMWMDHTSLYRRILPSTQNRRSWAKLVHKPESKPRLRQLSRQTAFLTRLAHWKQLGLCWDNEKEDGNYYSIIGFILGLCANGGKENGNLRVQGLGWQVTSCLGFHRLASGVSVSKLWVRG